MPKPILHCVKLSALDFFFLITGHPKAALDQNLHPPRIALRLGLLPKSEDVVALDQN
jgi:hypothetical protein